MPELPEVETTRRGLLPTVVNQEIVRVIVRDRRLRWPIPPNLAKTLEKRVVGGVLRRGKYLLWDVEAASGGGYLLCHLGMSGALFATPATTPPARHDHVDIVLGNQTLVRYHDPRRFGAMLWIKGAQAVHPLLAALGPEPLGEDFDGRHLFTASRGRAISVKEFIMNSHVVVGVGNIYAAEALFLAGIRPTTAAGRLSRPRYELLAAAIRETLTRAIDAGGSSLRDYRQVDGQPGYFQLNAMVYGRDGAPCRVCGSLIRVIRQGQRRTDFCAQCQR